MMKPNPPYDPGRIGPSELELLSSFRRLLLSAASFIEKYVARKKAELGLTTPSETERAD